MTVSLLIVGCALGLLSSCDQGPVFENPGVVSIQQDHLLFSYHLRSDSAGLFDLSRDPRCLKNLADARPDESARLRSLLEEKLGLADLADLRFSPPSGPEGLGGLSYLR